MDYSDKTDKTRRTMSDGLQMGKLTEEALDFVKGTAAKPTMTPTPVSPPEPPPTSFVPPVNPSVSDLYQNRLSTELCGDDSVVVPGILSVSFRLPASLATQLARVSATRKLKRRRPFSQQDIVAEALRAWFHRHGYLDLDRG